MDRNQKEEIKIFVKKSVALHDRIELKKKTLLYKKNIFPLWKCLLDKDFLSVKGNHFIVGAIAIDISNKYGIYLLIF